MNWRRPLEMVDGRDQTMLHAPSFSVSTRYTRSLLIVAIALLFPLGTLLAQQAPRDRFTVVEMKQSFGTLQQAINAIGARRGTISIAPGIYQECAVQEDGVVTYVAEQQGTVAFERRACEGKAALVLRGLGAEIRGITFRKIAVADGNGAGIRLEKGSLNIAFSRFEDSQQGILTANDQTGRIHIVRSTFSGLGTCEHSAGCAHSIYVGDYGELAISESRFEKGTGGHYVKARAANVFIRNNSFDDAAGRGTNYMIDLPAGSRGEIADNWFIQGRDKENYSAFIALGAEQNLHPSDGLQVTGNEARFVPGLRRASVFLADWTGSQVAMSSNRLAQGLKPYEQR
ncbi:MAG: right-handed parallel beta-helix repeat-containing protein [Pseudomonadota bacterium]